VSSDKVPVIFLYYFTQTHIILTKVSKNCQHRISRKSIQQKPSSYVRTDRHDKANSCFSRLIIRNYYLTLSRFSDINTSHVRLNYYILFATLSVLMLPVITEHDLSSVSFQSSKAYVICLNNKKKSLQIV
jgi:hypothetical protein